MHTTKLGRQGLTVSAQGLGCMGMSQSYGPADDAESKATLDRALELGITLFDTADVYGATGAGGFGANERLLGDTLAGRRDEFVLATKCGIQDIVPGGTTRFQLGASPDYVRSACDASLQRLQTDHIDLYYLHRVDPQTPIEDSIGAMAELVDAGKVRYLGVSEVTAA
jgi:aryl-alcohol dehydrogenase-like predicted oxidoreductase